MKKHVTNLAGSNIYLDKYGNSVYYNIFDKKGYVVSKEVEQKFRVFYNRYALMVIMLILLGDYLGSVLRTVSVGVIGIIVIELYFRAIFLKKLKSIKDFKRDKKVSTLESIIKSKEKEKAIMKACAYVLLSVLIVINAIQQNFNIIFLLLSGVASIASLYYGIINMVAITKMRAIK